MVTTCLLPLRHHFFSLLCIITAVIALSFPALADPQENKGLEPLAHAMKAFQAGDYQQATQLIEEAQKAGLDRSLSARALLLRAQVNEKSGNTARALSDYSSALWLSALSTEDSKV